MDSVWAAPIERPPARALINSVIRRLELSQFDVRLAHWACGGNASRAELAAFLAGDGNLPDREYDTLAAAMNDRLIERHLDPSVPYSED